MTNSEALAAKVGYPLSTNSLDVALATRGLVASDIFDSTADIQKFELAYADGLIMVLSAPAGISEGGYSITAGDRTLLSDIANGIYKKYIESSPLGARKKVARFVQRW